MRLELLIHPSLYSFVHSVLSARCILGTRETVVHGIDTVAKQLPLGAGCSHAVLRLEKVLPKKWSPSWPAFLPGSRVVEPSISKVVLYCNPPPFLIVLDAVSWKGHKKGLNVVLFFCLIFPLV